MKAVIRELRWDVPSVARLRELAMAPLPRDGRATAAVRSLHRDIYLDTRDGVLRARGAVCRLQVGANDRHTLALAIHEPGGMSHEVEAPARSTDPLEAVREPSAVTRSLQGIVDPATLVPCATVEVERLTRRAAHDWLRRPGIELQYDIVTVRRDTSARHFQQVTLRGRPGAARAVDALANVLGEAPGLRPAEPALQRALLLLKWMPVTPAGAQSDGGMSAASSEIRLSDAEFLHPELSFLASQARVLTLAADATVPLAERLRFVAIVAANLDEFFMVRVAGLKLAAPELAEESAAAWGDVLEQMQAIARSARELQAEHYRVAAACLAAASAHGVRIRTWAELGVTEQAHLRDRYREEIHPALTPLAMTMSPGHPFPHVPHLSLSVAVVLRDPGGGASHFAQVEIPPDVPRLLRVAGDDDDAGDRGAMPSPDVIPVEEVIRANLGALYPGMDVEHAYLFRVTRSSVLAVDESGSSLLDAVDHATQGSGGDGVVRVEVERAMPALIRELVLDAMTRESGTAPLPLGWDDLYEADGPLDLRSLAALALPVAPALHYPPLVPRVPVAPMDSLLDAIAARDLLLHHPYDSFAESVVRFVREAADDPDVTVLKLTLYRVGEQSPIVDALRRAARNGKQVYAFVELRARFDEATNVKWVRTLEKAGVHVVYGLRGLKTHAKAMLVVRREGTRLRQYVHIGTGNYNARTGLAYTDLSLLSADEGLASDLADVFNSLTGSSTPSAEVSHGMLVAPGRMLAALLACIEREAAIARRGRPASIRIKVNGLSEPEIIRALQRAAGDGVRVDLLVRGICTLRPPRPGGREHLRVVATVGRFLEHSRIYHFANDGAPEYYIGSADLRPRNLRRRVELLAPVRDGEAQARLDALLRAYLEDATAWDLGWDGTYAKRGGRGPGTQESLLAELESSNEANAKWQHGLRLSAR